MSMPCIVRATPDPTSPAPAFPPSSGSLLVMQMRRPSVKWWAWLFVNPCHIIYRHRRLRVGGGQAKFDKACSSPKYPATSGNFPLDFRKFPNTACLNKLRLLCSVCLLNQRYYCLPDAQDRNAAPASISYPDSVGQSQNPLHSAF